MPYHFPTSKIGHTYETVKLRKEKFNQSTQPRYHWKQDRSYLQVVCLILIQILSFPEETRMKVGCVFSEKPWISNKQRNIKGTVVSNDGRKSNVQKKGSAFTLFYAKTCN